MANTLLKNGSLKKFIQSVNINEEKKKFLTSKVPEMDLEEREKLFKALTEIYLLDLEEKEAIEKVKKFWKE